MYGTWQCTVMLTLTAVYIIMISITGVDAISLRDYCDEQVYKKAGDKSAMKPNKYALPYWKRCLNHDEWIKCIEETSKTEPNGVTLMPYEKNFPTFSDMHSYARKFCQLKVNDLPKIQGCSYDHNSCNRKFEGLSQCSDSVERVLCLWKKLRRCNSKSTCPIVAYEYSLLGRACLKQEQISNLTITDEIAKNCVFGRARMGWKEANNGQNIRAKPFITTGTSILVFLLAYYARHYYYI